MQKPLTILLTVLLLLGSGMTVVNAQSNHAYAEFKRGFTKGLQDRKNALQKMRAYSLDDEKTNLLVNHYMSVVNDPAVVERLFEEVKSLGVIEQFLRNPKSAESEIQKVASLGYDLFDSLAVKGLQRLDNENQKQYLRSLYAMLNAVPPTLCRVLALGDISGQKDETAAALYAISKMTRAEVESYLRMIRRAIHAEVRDFPSIRSITENQKKSAEYAFEAAFVGRLHGNPKSNQIIATLLDMQNASPVDVCDTTKQIILAMLSMNGTLGEWKIKSFVESLQ
jgi:hypothetical protein